MIPDIPDKQTFKIGEVGNLLDLKSHVLRYWESEFPDLRPKKTATGQRLFRKADVDLLLVIRHLLHVRRFTVEGARLELARLKRRNITVPSLIDQLRAMGGEVEEHLEEESDQQVLTFILGQAPRQITPNPESLKELRYLKGRVLELEPFKAECEALRLALNELGKAHEELQSQLSAPREESNVESSGTEAASDEAQVGADAHLFELELKALREALAEQEAVAERRAQLLSEANDANAKISQQLTDLIDAAAERDSAALEALTGELEEARRLLAEKSRDVELLEDSRQRLESDFQVLHDAEASAKASLTALRAELEASQAKAEEASAQLVKLEKENRSTREREQELAKRVVKYDEEKHHSSQKLEALQREQATSLEDARAQVAKLESEVEALRLGLQEHEQHLAQSRQAESDLRSVAQSKDDEVTNLRAQLEALGAKLDEKVALLQDANDSLENKAAALAASRDEAEKLRAKQQEARAHSESLRVDEVEAARREVRTELLPVVEEAERSLEELSQRYTYERAQMEESFDAQYATLQGELVSSEQAREELQKEVHSLREESLHLHEGLQQTRQELKRAQDATERLEETLERLEQLTATLAELEELNRSLRDQSTGLQGELEQSLEVIASLREEIESNAARVTDLQTQLQDAMESRRGVERELAAAQAQLVATTSSGGELEAAFGALKVEHDKLQSICRGHVESNEQLASELSRAEGLKLALEEQIAELRRENEEQGDEFRLFREDMAREQEVQAKAHDELASNYLESQRQNEALTQEVTSKLEALYAAAELRESLETKLTESQEVCTAAKTELASMQARQDASLERIEELETEVRSQSEALDARTEELAQLAAEGGRLEELLSNGKDEKESMRSEVEALRARLLSAEQGLEQQRREWDNERATVATELDALREQLTEGEMRNTHTQEERQKAEEQAARELQESTELIRELHEQIAKLETEAADAKSEAGTLEERLVSVQTTGEEAAERARLAEEHISSLREDLALAQERYESHVGSETAEREKLSSKLMEALKESAHYEEKLRAVEATSGTLSESLEAAEAKREMLQERLLELAPLSDQLAMQESRATELERELNTLKRQFDESSARAEDLEREAHRREEGLREELSYLDQRILRAMDTERRTLSALRQIAETLR